MDSLLDWTKLVRLRVSLLRLTVAIAVKKTMLKRVEQKCRRICQDGLQTSALWTLELAGLYCHLFNKSDLIESELAGLLSMRTSTQTKIQMLSGRTTCNI